MRIIFKVLLAPISFLLTVFVAFFAFLIKRLAILLHIISGVTVIVALANFAQCAFGWPYRSTNIRHTLGTSIILAVIAFILSPYGLPTAAIWMIGKLDGLNHTIKSI